MRSENTLSLAMWKQILAQLNFKTTHTYYNISR